MPHISGRSKSAELAQAKPFGTITGMGGSYGSIHVRTADTAPVRVALESISRDAGTKFLLSPAIDGWVSVFPEGNGQDMEISARLAKLVVAPVIHLVVHDDDVLAYQFYEGGELVDAYNSCPDYFGGEPADRGGVVERLNSILPDAAKRKALAKLLSAERFTFEVERLQKLTDLLGLPNAVTAYEYLQDGEREGIRQWKQFIHIPDPKAEQVAKRAAKAKAKAEFGRLAEDGLLIFEKLGGKTAHPLFSTSPVWCLDPVGSDVLVAWSGSPIGHASPTPVERINPRTGATTPTKLFVPDKVHCLAASPTSRWLAAGCASGEWKAQVWNIESGELAFEIPQARAVEQVCFSRDGETLFAISEKTLTIASLSRPGSVETVGLPDAAKAMVVHPAGEHLAVECAGMVALVHLPTRKMATLIWIPEPPGPMRDVMEFGAAHMAGKHQEMLARFVPASELEAHKEQAARHWLPKQNVCSLSFGQTGNYLFCGTTKGVCVLDWVKALATSNQQSLEPTAFVPAETILRDDGTPDLQLIRAVPIDSVARRILFAGLEAKIRFANISDNRTGDLLVPPAPTSFFKLELSPDRSALVGTAIELPRERSKPALPRFQVWNYPALCRAAGLDS